LKNDVAAITLMFNSDVCEKRIARDVLACHAFAPEGCPQLEVAATFMRDALIHLKAYRFPVVQEFTACSKKKTFEFCMNNFFKPGHCRNQCKALKLITIVNQQIGQHFVAP
jgi:hypothetical protein